MAARYRVVWEDLRGKILNETYPVGSLLPTEEELTILYGVSRPTVRHALSLLAEEGLVDRRKRRGTLVCEPQSRREYATHVQSFEAEMHTERRIPRTKVISCTREGADGTVCQALHIKEDDAVLRLVRVRYANEDPNVLVVTYVPLDVCPEVEQVDFEQCSLYQTLRSHGHEVVRARRRLNVELADAGSAAMLGMSTSDPVFVFHSYGYTDDNVTVEYSVATYRGSTNSFEFTIEMQA
ncbi:MAG: GntR family transcriptional regulator [Coriobacteriales bacterium]|nr:GntR family transcriptional regulator [Coriobacteriales bacterium]